MRLLPLIPVVGLALAMTAAVAFAEEIATSQPRMSVGPARFVGADQLRFMHGAEAPLAQRASVPSPNESESNRVPKPPTTEPQVPTDVDGPHTSAFSYSQRLSRAWASHPASGEPPDPMIAAGTDHVVSVVNFRILMNTKDGTEVFNSTLATFFGIPVTEPGAFDTKIVYDRNAQRFWIATIAKTCGTTPSKSRVYLAVSSTSDPTQGWYHYGPYSNLQDNNWSDYPGLGVSNNVVVLTWNLIPCVPAVPPNHWNALWIFNKSPMLSGGGTFYDAFLNVTGFDGGEPGTLMPATTWGAPVGAETFVASIQFSGGGANLQGTLHGVQLPADYPTGFPTLNRQTVTTPNPGPLQLAPQLGGPATIMTWNIGSAPLSCVYRNGHVVVVSHYGVTTPPATQVWLYDFSVASWPTISCQTGGFFDGTSTYYWPAAAINAYGDVAMVFGRSSTAEFAGSRWTYRFAGEPAFQASLPLQAGVDYYGEDADTGANSYRWGDYGGCAVDPVDEGFWIFHQHATLRATFAPRRRWGTRIGYIPRAVFVDRAFSGTPENGRRSTPWRTVTFGHLSALGGNDLVIRTGSYPETVTLNKPVTIIPDGGPVTIGQ